MGRTYHACVRLLSAVARHPLVRAHPRVPLVMPLAGVSAWYSLQHRDNRCFIRERTARVFLPLIVGTLLLVPPQVWLESRLHHEFEESFLSFYPTFFAGIYPEGNFSWHHLWFLAHLYGYSLLALPPFRYLPRDEGSRTPGIMARVSGGRGPALARVAAHSSRCSA